MFDSHSSTPELPSSVSVVDDDPDVRSFLAALISTIGVTVNTYASADEFLSSNAVNDCHCLIVDLRLKGMSGLQLQRALVDRGTPTPILFISGHAEVAPAVEAMRNGAIDFIEKPFGAQLMLDKVQLALAKARQLHVEKRHAASIEARFALLTQREKAIVSLVIAGKSSKAIAEQLRLSVRTVENHRARIMEKLHVSSTVDLVRLLV